MINEKSGGVGRASIMRILRTIPWQTRIQGRISQLHITTPGDMTALLHKSTLFEKIPGYDDSVYQGAALSHDHFWL